MKVTIINIIGVLIIYQSLIFVFTLLLKKKDKPLFVKVLISFCLLIIFHFTYMFLEMKNIINFTYFGPLFGLIYGPIYLVYTKSLIFQGLDFKKIALHFIPAAFTFFGLIFYNNDVFNVIETIGLSVSIHYIIYLTIALNLLYKYRIRLKTTTSSFYNISLFWLEILIYLQFSIICLILLEGYFQSSFIKDNLVLAIYSLTLIIINCFYYLGLKQVRLFKGFKEGNTKAKKSASEYTISEDLFNSYVDKINDYFEQEKPYLEFDISLKELSIKLSISSRNLSHVINKKFQKNFYDFINHHRLKLVKQSLRSSNKPIKEIMYNCGFSNKATFNYIFKKSTGLTPTQYREKQKT